MRGLVHFNSKGWTPGSAIFRALGVACPMLVSALVGKPGWGALVGLGALYAGVASFTGIQPVRVRQMLLSSLATAIVTGIGCGLNRGDAIPIVGVTLLAFVFSLVGAIRTSFSIVSIQAVALLIVMTGIPGSAASPLGNAGLVLCGGLFQTALLSLAWPINPYFVERKAMADVFFGLASFVRARSTEGGDIPDSDPFVHAVARLDEAQRYVKKPEHVRMQRSLEVAETVRAALVGYARAYSALEVDGCCPDWLAQVNETLATALEVSAKRMTDGDYGSAALETPDLDREVEHTVGDVRHWLKLIDDQLAHLNDMEPDPPLEPGDSHWLPRWESVTGIFDSRNLRGLAASHAFRYAVSVGGASAMARVAHVSHSYWFPLTVALTLRSDYSSTLTRGLGRAAGTIFGVGAAWIVYAALRPSTGSLIVLVAVSAWFAYAVYRASYTLYALAITMYVVFSVSAAGVPQHEVGEIRTMATVLGVIFVVAVSLAWPLWRSPDVSGVMRDAFRAQAEYGRLVENQLAGKPANRTQSVRRRARSLRIDAQNLARAAQDEPLWARKGHLDEVARDMDALAAGAADMLYVHAEAIGNSSKAEMSESDLDQTLRKAIENAESRAR